jgi:hypothetical protein
MQDWTAVCDAAGRPINPGEPNAQQVRVNSGMMVVVPAWKLAELLNSEAVAAKRREIEDGVRAEEQGGGE